MAAKKRKNRAPAKGRRQESVRPEPAAQEVKTPEAEAQADGARKVTLRQAFLARCAETAARGTEKMDCAKGGGPAEEKAPADAFLADVLNGWASGLDGSGARIPLPLYVCAPGSSRPVRCGRQGVYRGPLAGCYELFCEENRPETEHVQQSILNMALQDAAAGRDLREGFGLMCLMPDVVDAFNRVFRAQLCCQGAPLFQVPRSIALAWTLRAAGREVPPEFLCADYDGEALYAIKICEIEGEDGPVFVRMGREVVHGEHLSYRKLAENYLWRYERKHKLELTEEARANLIDTKLLQRLVRDPETPVLVDNGGAPLRIEADQGILDALRGALLRDLGQIRMKKKIPVYGLCGFFPGHGENLFSMEDLERGCMAIRERGEARRVLWQEYLPHLELEVSRNGVFDVVELIGADHRRQNVSTFLLEEEVKIPVSNGLVAFPANGEDHYDLPLIREVYGRHNKEKLARFQLAEPLERDVEAELTVYYRYGDIDSYKLTARSPDLPEPLESVWCDSREVLENLAPSYQELERHDFGPGEFQKVYGGFTAFASAVRGQRRMRPAASRLVYERPANSGRYYSSFLWDLNQRGQPYFPIQNFFRLDAFTDGRSRDLIQKMLLDGVFDTVSKVLRGELPPGNGLGMDPRSGRDAGQVLIQNMAEIACNFGCFFLLRDTDPEKEFVSGEVEKVLSYFREKHPREVQIWAPITRYVPRIYDVHGVWDSFSRALRSLNPQRPGRMIYDLRAISAVCYQTKNWVFEFYHGPKGPEEVRWVIRNILAVLESPECLAPRPGEGYNPRKIRDVLELLLCLCRLKTEDPKILDCNAPETKSLVKRLKEIDRSMRELEARHVLKSPFNSRLGGIRPPAAYRRVNPVIYALIQTLTGGKPVSLVGFTSDGEERGVRRREQ